MDGIKVATGAILKEESILDYLGVPSVDTRVLKSERRGWQRNWEETAV